MSKFLGTAVLRKEDPALLSGRGRYADDLPVPTGTLHAHVIRSPHAHARIVGIDASEALAQDGVWAVVTGEEVRKLSDPFLIALKAPVNQWSLAVERVRYVGEPVALVVADTRYLAEDAADLVRVDYEPLAAVIDPQAAREKSAPLRDIEAKSIEISVLRNATAATKSAFERADARVALTCTYPRNSFTPMECYVVVAEFRPADQSYDVLANFQGPFSTHPVMARALRVAGPSATAHPPPRAASGSSSRSFLYRAGLDRRAHHRPPGEMGRGSTGIVAAARVPTASPRSKPPSAGRPHSGAAARPTRGLRRVPARADAAPLYRMHGAVTGTYDIRTSRVVSRVVLITRCRRADPRLRRPAALPRAGALVADRHELKLDHLEVIKRNRAEGEVSVPRCRWLALHSAIICAQ